MVLLLVAQNGSRLTSCNEQILIFTLLATATPVLLLVSAPLLPFFLPGFASFGLRLIVRFLLSLGQLHVLGDVFVVLILRVLIEEVAIRFLCFLVLLSVLTLRHSYSAFNSKMKK